MDDELHALRDIAGRLRLYYVEPDMPYMRLPNDRMIADAQGRWHRWHTPSNWIPNTILFEWGTLFGNLLLRKGVTYGIGGLYLEFENVASPGDPVTIPGFDRGPQSGVEYYNS
ncbi:MAG: hypothetical protein L0312_00050, partial [Acidobacteria bacterium]|nr:hypothetical protein [Acidobacteriota bacterium]